MTAKTLQNVLLLSGYRGTGKDTLFTAISEASITNTSLPQILSDLLRQASITNTSLLQILSDLLRQAKSIESLGYRVYSKSGNSQLLVGNKLRRVSFADALKIDVGKKIGITDLQILESIKNKPLAQGIDTKSSKTFRDLLIEEAAKNRKIDNDYYCMKAFNDIKSDESTIVVTDNRYPNEVQYVSSLSNYKVITARVFRSSVAIPPLGVDSEHAMDTFLTDYLICDDFTKACVVFPQYSKYSL